MTRADAENHNEPKHRNLKLATPRNPSSVAIELIIVSLLFDYVAMAPALVVSLPIGLSARARSESTKEAAAEEAHEWRPEEGCEGLSIGLLKAGVACAEDDL
jgi:hypothetical protein